MTTAIAAAHYLASHAHDMEGKRNAIFNPNSKPIDQLPIIYGWNNGGATGMLSAVLIAEDGTPLGSHCCSSEGYMMHDLGILEGTRPDRHEHFQAHYPEGYRMEFVRYDECDDHKGLNEAHAKH